MAKLQTNITNEEKKAVLQNVHAMMESFEFESKFDARCADASRKSHVLFQIGLLLTRMKTHNAIMMHRAKRERQPMLSQ